MFIGGPLEQRAKEMLQPGRQQLRKAVGLFTNLDLVNDPACWMCRDQDETHLHLICECSTLTTKRYKHFGIGDR